jgi:hypothetical protein
MSPDRPHDSDHRRRLGNWTGKAFAHRGNQVVGAGRKCEEAEGRRLPSRGTLSTVAANRSAIVSQADP